MAPREGAPAARPEAARLLAALADPDCGFDAIVVGEFERAFYGDRYRQLAPLFALYGVLAVGLPRPAPPSPSSGTATCSSSTPPASAGTPAARSPIWSPSCCSGLVARCASPPGSAQRFPDRLTPVAGGARGPAAGPPVDEAPEPGRPPAGYITGGVAAP
ncbi:hypothetical protein [Rugosimonospora acidiphila]|uniref:hypothetical protein n=1 Tax=Rugosimonospora acidiphila TaxID=556531 RepID=UPI0031E5059D